MGEVQYTCICFSALVAEKWHLSQEQEHQEGHPGEATKNQLQTGCS